MPAHDPDRQKRTNGGDDNVGRGLRIAGGHQTAALVGRDGSIDWQCFPRFDGGAAFAALLGTEQHGRWLITPKGSILANRRRYQGDTLILETEMDTEDGTIRLVDFMPPRGAAPDVVRIVVGLTGRVRMRMELRLRFDYGRVVPWVRKDDGAVVAVAGPPAGSEHPLRPAVKI